MDAQNEDLSYQLPRDLYYQVIHVLRAALPPPVTDTREDLARRDNAAVAQVASLLPANGEEALLAAQFIAANAQALDCLRLVREYPRDIRTGLQCMAQAASMMRQARGARSLLMRIQAQRQKREASPAGADSAAWVEHCATGLMSDALRPLAPRAAPQVHARADAVTPAVMADRVLADVVRASGITSHQEAAAAPGSAASDCGCSPPGGPAAGGHTVSDPPASRPHAPAVFRRARDGPAARAAWRRIREGGMPGALSPALK